MYSNKRMAPIHKWIFLTLLNFFYTSNYSLITPFNDSMKFRLRNVNINDFLLINLPILLITIRFFRYFDRHSGKTVTLSELLLNIINFSNKIVDVMRKSHEFYFKIVRVITIVVSNPVNSLVNDLLWRQSISSGYSMTSRFAAILLLSPPSYILYTLVVPIRRSGSSWAWVL